MKIHNTTKNKVLVLPRPVVTIENCDGVCGNCGCTFIGYKVIHLKSWKFCPNCGDQIFMFEHAYNEPDDPSKLGFKQNKETGAWY